MVIRKMANGGFGDGVDEETEAQVRVLLNVS